MVVLLVFLKARLCYSGALLCGANSAVHLKRAVSIMLLMITLLLLLLIVCAVVLKVVVKRLHVLMLLLLRHEREVGHTRERVVIVLSLCGPVL